MKEYFKNKKEKACSPKRRGFTLMELMIVIAIIVIMTSVGLVSINESRRNKELESSARKVVAVIREMQNNALSGKNADICDRWIFKYGQSTLENFTTGAGRGAGDCDIPITPVEYDIDRGIAFTAPDTLVFTVPNGENISGAKDIILCRSGSSSCYAICVNSVGKIEELIGSSCP